MQPWISYPSVRHRWIGYGLSFVLVVVLAACGNKGPLRMPDDPDPGADSAVDVGQQRSVVAGSGDGRWFHTQSGQSR